MRSGCECKLHMLGNEDVGRTTVFWHAGGQLGMAHWLLEEQGQDADAADEAGVTPLMVAAEADCASLAQLLLAHGAGLERRSRAGCTPLHHAARAGALPYMHMCT